jgi:hypothetical protein
MGRKLGECHRISMSGNEKVSAGSERMGKIDAGVNDHFATPIERSGVISNQSAGGDGAVYLQFKHALPR